MKLSNGSKIDEKISLIISVSVENSWNFNTKWPKNSVDSPPVNLLRSEESCVFVLKHIETVRLRISIYAGGTKTFVQLNNFPKNEKKTDQNEQMFTLNTQ